MRRRSARQQRALNRALFGPGPKPVRDRKRRPPKPYVIPPGVPGHCWACGDICEPYRDPWTCPHCGVVYQPTVGAEIVQAAGAAGEE